MTTTCHVQMTDVPFAIGEEFSSKWQVAPLSLEQYNHTHPVLTRTLSLLLSERLSPCASLNVCGTVCCQFLPYIERGITNFCRIE